MTTRSIDEAAEWYDTHDAWNDEDDEIEVEFKQPLDKIVSIRFTDAQWKRLYRTAKEMGVGPSTLARIWILERIGAGRDDTGDMVAGA